MLGRHLGGLHPVGAHHLTAGALRDQEVVESPVKFILVPSADGGPLEALVELQVEHFVAKAENPIELIGGSGKPDLIAPRGDGPGWRRTR